LPSVEKEFVPIKLWWQKAALSAVEWVPTLSLNPQL